MERKINLATLFKDARVYSPNYLGKRDVLCCGGKIIVVGEELNPNIPQLNIVNAKDMIIIPGLIDGHVHVTGGGGEDGFSSRVEELTLSQLVSVGVTTVIGVLGTDSITRNVQSLLAKVKALKEQGMSAYCLTGAYTIDSPTITGSVKEDICFIQEILGVKLAINDHRSSMPTVQELVRLAADVRLASLTAKKPGVVHMHTGKGKNGFKIIFDALKMSDLPILHFRPTHCGKNMEDAIKFGKMGGYIDFTASKEHEKTAVKLIDAMKEVPLEQITLSSDAGGSIPIWNERNEIIGMGVGTPDTLLPVIRDLVKTGDVPFEKALRIVTSNPADSLRLKEKGRIREGADADIVLLDENMKVLETYCMGQRMFLS